MLLPLSLLLLLLLLFHCCGRYCVLFDWLVFLIAKINTLSRQENEVVIEKSSRFLFSFASLSMLPRRYKYFISFYIYFFLFSRKQKRDFDLHSTKWWWRTTMVSYNYYYSLIERKTQQSTMNTPLVCWSFCVSDELLRVRDRDIRK